MSDMDKTAARQRKIGEELETLRRNYKKDSTSRKTEDYLTNKLEVIDSLWYEFRTNDEELKLSFDPNWPYFKNNYKKVVSDIVDDLKNSIQSVRLKLSAANENDDGKDENQNLSDDTGTDDNDEEDIQNDDNENSDELKKASNKNGHYSSLFKNGMNLKQNISLFYMKCTTAERSIRKMEDMASSEIKEVAFFRVQEDIRRTLDDLTEMDREIKVLGDMKSSTYKQFIYKDTAEQLIERAEAAIAMAEEQVAPSPSNAVKKYDIKLPRIQIPTFNGTYTEWQTFYDLYTKLIHKNESLSKAMRMQYLKNCLKGDAARLIAHFAGKEQNYDIAWMLLVDKYHDKRLIAHEYITKLIKIPDVQNGTAKELQNVHDAVYNIAYGLEEVIKADEWGKAIMLHMLLKKMDKNTFSEYEDNLKKPKEIQDLQEFLNFLAKRIIHLEHLENNYQSNKQNDKNKGFHNNKNDVVIKKDTSNKDRNCQICNEKHAIKECKKFVPLTVEKRLEAVKAAKLCTNCLRPGHRINTCTNKRRCNICEKRHHSLLHNNNFKNKHPIKESTKVTTINNDNENKFIINKPAEGVILTTMLIQVMVNGYTYVLRALLDQGSTTNIMTNEAATLLNVKRHKTYAEISGLGKAVEKSAQFGTLTMHSRYNNDFKLTFSAFILNDVAETTPSMDVKEKWEHLENLKLADPNYKKSSNIDIILGGGVYSRILLPGVIKAGMDEPIAQQTEMGWIVSGPSKNITGISKEITLITHVEENFELEKFWQIEEIQEHKTRTLEEIECEKFYKETHKRLDNGRYMVHLPFKNDETHLGASRKIAVATLLQLEKQFKRSPELKSKYVKCLQEYFDNNQIKLAEKTEEQLSYMENGIRKYKTNYLPHHAVKKESDRKFRVVFDASRKTSSKVALNEKLMIGPVIQDELVTLLTRWRKHKLVFTADIEKMYRQIKITPEHAEYQRMVWRENENDDIKDYILPTVTFGTASAPHTAIRTLKQLSLDEKHNFPIGSQVLDNDFYVDDVMTGGSSCKEVKTKLIELTAILATAGMKLRKFSSNSDEVMEIIPENLRELQIPLKVEPDQSIKTLGIVWHPEQDYFKYQVNLDNNEGQYTKRMILAEVAKIYDPLGWIAPLIVKGKILMQKLWLKKATWDEALHDEIAIEWRNIMEELIQIEEIKIPRWIRLEPDSSIELHGFCDASEEAYAAVIYSRVINKGHIYISLICAKTKVAPMKQISLPRLELCGATLLSKLMARVQKTLEVPSMDIKLYSDSTITLAWIKDQPRKYNTFVANRIGEIQTNMPNIPWYHVKGTENPADVASRGMMPSKLVDHKLWWNGPTWLKTKHIKYNAIQHLSTDVELRKQQTVHHINIVEKKSDIFQRFSNFERMKRVLTYCWRFIRKTQRKSSLNGFLQLSELRETESKIIQIVQNEEFGNEMKRLKNNEKINRKSGLLSLNPFIDKENQLRVGGRLQNSELTYNQKHPIILPYNHYVTKLLTQQVHHTLLHGGSKLMTATIRQKFWVIKCKRLIKTIINNCTKCVRAKGKVAEQLMGNLPVSRVTPARPFTNCGVDLTGSIEIKSSKLRRASKYKGYVALFICMAIKAIHLEVVTSGTAEDFIAAFKRLVSRRGAIENMYSDNAGNFTMASKILNLETEQQKLDYQSEIAQGLLQCGTQFHVIPPKNPTHAGYWERSIGSFKHHLKRVIGEQKLTYEELTTVVVQIEGVLNSRPLCPMTNDPDDFEVLTPGHFLIGGPIISHPESSVIQTNMNKLTRWKLIQRMYEDFWKSWKEDYLSNLQLRTKWKIPQENIIVGDIVSIKEEMVPPTRWPLGRVIQIHPGKDDKVRVALIKTQKSVLKRPIVKLCLLPTKEATSNNKTEETAAPETAKKAKKTPLRKVTTKLRTFIIMLLAASLIIPVETGNIFNITKFENQPGIYFENWGSTYIAAESWKIVSYFNFSTYENELNAIEKSINQMELKCKTIKDGKSSDICSVTTMQFQHMLEEIHQTNDIIKHERILNRTKRQLIMGALAIAGAVGAKQ